MIHDLQQATDTEFAGADVCIVGSGAAGVTLAVELARQGKRVLLLEGGGRELEASSQEMYRSEVNGLPHRGIHSGRFRSYGGTTTAWGGQLLELTPIDFAKREWIAGSGWPIPADEMEPYYARALRLHGMSGSEAEDSAVWRRLRETPPDLGLALECYFTRWLPEPRLTELHAAVLAGENIGVYLHANAVELMLDTSGSRVTGVRCRTLEGKEAIFSAPAVVLALGAIETARFLLQPDRRGPWTGNEWLGRHFADHIDANCARLVLRDARRFHAAFDNVYLSGYKYHPKMRLHPAVQKEEGLLNVAATMHFASDTDTAMARVKTVAKALLRGNVSEVRAGDMGEMVRNIPVVTRQTWRYAHAHRSYNPASAAVSLRVHCEQEPLNGSYVSLSGERDALGLFRTQLHWGVTPLERRTMRRFTEIACAALESAGLATGVPDPALMSEDTSAFDACCDDSNHHMGGARMGETCRDGVVDADLRLHGTENAYVCSSAVFPTTGFSNPTLTIFALAIRLADRLAARTGGMVEASATSSQTEGISDGDH